MADTEIEWADRVWNPTTGCDKVSPGCDHCYALTMAKRLKGIGSAKYQRDGDPKTSGPGFGVSTHDDALTLPLRWRKPAKVFVNSMSDLFHAEIPDAFIARVFAVMALAPQHTFQLLTKRHARMRSLLAAPDFERAVGVEWLRHPARVTYTPGPRWPLPNVWAGVSVEDQHWADIRIPALLETPSAVRWISAEPLLGPLDLSAWLNTAGTLVCGCGVAPPGAPGWSGGCSPSCMWPAPSGLDWVVTGGESGSGARPAHPAWFRSIRDQCKSAGVAYHHKQNGAYIQGFMGLGHSPTSGERDGETPAGAQGMRRVGKKAAGRLLDGQVHDAYPGVSS